jgi:predicted nucleotidyltransferase
VRATAEKLAEILAARPEVEMAVLFGSAARAQLLQPSDIDVGLRTKEMDVATRHRLEADLERCARRALDVVDLDRAPPQLRFEIARDGILLLERRKGAWVSFRARAFVDWWDFAPIARRIHRAAVDRLREGARGAR